MSDEDLFRRAVMLVWESGNASTSFLQRRLEIGYNAAARLVERMESLAVVSKPNHVGKRTVRSPDDLRKALNIHDEVIDIVEGDEAKAAIMLKALVDGLRSTEERPGRMVAPTGASARSIFVHLGGVGKQDGDYPRDADDFGRCEAFLEANPALDAIFPRMVEVNAYWAALVPRWREIQRIDREGKTALIREIIRPIQAADPSHAQIGIASIRTGPITFMGVDLATGPDQTSTVNLTREQIEAMTKRKPDPAAPEFESVNNHNYAVSSDELRQFIERAEQLASEKKDIAEQEKELFAEAKGRGYDTKVLRKVIALRKRKPDDIAEEEAVLEMYKQALGMS